VFERLKGRRPMVEQKVEAFLKRHDIKLKNSNVIVGVSGGPDSLALLYFLWSRREAWNLTIVCAHVDHMFRGIESYHEAKFVEQFCIEHNIPFEAKQIDVPAYMATTKKSSQVAAREVRYAFYKRVMADYQNPYLALGHHGDDQIETVLMRLTRGSTGKARAGISLKRNFSNGEIIRPFLCLTKQEIEDYCKQHQLNPRQDPSNLKNDYSRNRFRNQLLPFLKKENPKVHEHFQRFSEELRDDEDLLYELTVKEMNKVMEKNHGEITLDIKSFTTMPMPLQRRGIQLILNYLYQEKPNSLSAIHTNQLFTLINHSQPSGSLDFPNGLRITRSYHCIYFQFSPLSPSPYRFELTAPGIVQLPDGSKISIENRNDAPSVVGLDQLVLDLSEYSFPIIIRTRKNGDRMSLKGMNGTKKIKDIFIDEKLPIHKRNEWPIIADHEDRILWVPGIKHASIPAKDKLNSRYLLFTYIRNEFF
jgi:tRNA(Ile)-lysidine synthase